MSKMSVYHPGKHNQHHSHLNPMQFGKKMKKDPGDQEKAKFGSSNTSKTMSIDKPGIKKAPKVHPHRRHAGVRSHRAK